MSAHLRFCNAFTLLLFFMLLNPSISDGFIPRRPQISFNLDNYKMNYRAGETANIVVTVRKDFESEKDRNAFNPNVSMNEVMGNSSLVTGLWFDRKNWRIFFMPIMVGKFNVFITEDRFHVYCYHISYQCTPGFCYD